MRLSHYFFMLLLCFLGLSASAEEKASSFGFLSGLSKLGMGADQDEQELLPPDQAFKLTVRVRDETYPCSAI